MAPKKDNKRVLVTAPPPVAVVAVVIALAAAFISLLPSLEVIDSAATLDLLTASAHLDTATLAYLRAVFAAIIFAVQGKLFFGQGWDENITYLEGSKLKECQVHFQGWSVLMWFTAQSWVLLGLYFAGASYLGLSNGTAPPNLLRVVLVLWEIAAPNAMLVSTVITYVIWPEMLSKGGSALTDGLRVPVVLMQHNANVVMVFTNLGLSSTPLVGAHAAIAPMFGLVYVVLFAWLPAPYIAPQHGAQYLYFFFDTTLGAKFGCLALLGLLACLLLFYALSVGLVSALALLNAQGTPLPAQFVALGVLCALLCRVRD